MNQILFKAAKDGDYEQVKDLLSQASDFNASDMMVAFRHAGNNHHEAISYLLLDPRKFGVDHAGVDIHAKRDDALISAVVNGLTEIVRLLLDPQKQGWNIEAANIHARNDAALRWAAGSGQLDIVHLLLAKGADVQALGPWGPGSVLIWAAQQGHKDMVNLLLEKGADIHACQDKALHEAAVHGHVAVVSFLLTWGADPLANNAEAIRWSAYHGQFATFRLLTMAS